MQAKFPEDKGEVFFQTKSIENTNIIRAKMQSFFLLCEALFYRKV